MSRKGPVLVAMLSLVIGCGHPPAKLTNEKLLSKGIGCLEAGDGDCIAEYAWDVEGRKTGLTPDAIRRVMKEAWKPATAGWKPVGELKVEPLESTQLSADQRYRTPDGRTRGFILIATQSDEGFKLTPLSLCLFTALGNAEQKSDENPFTAWKRMIAKNRAMFEEAGWKGVVISSNGEMYRTWDEMIKQLDGDEVKWRERKNKQGTKRNS
jgi:hypothetical protein